MISSYIKYLFTAKDEYHIHSPFVYDFYTKALKGKDNDTLVRLGVTTMVEIPVEKLLERYLSEREEHVFYYVRDIHQSKAKEEAWNAICGHPQVVLTLDFYRFGYVFYRKGMEKQNFVLRR